MIFLDFGSSESVKKALYRLETKDKIKRLSHGIYYKPKFSKIVGELLPSVEEIAQAIARRDKARIIPTGVYAENILGLTTQVPMKLVFLTDGASRVVKIDNKNYSNSKPLCRKSFYQRQNLYFGNPSLEKY